MQLKHLPSLALLSALIAPLSPAFANEVPESASKSHYLDRYEPVAIYALDDDPNAATVGDAHGKFPAVLHRKESGTPAVVKGARDFTGQAWNFKGVPSSLRSQVNGDFHSLGDIEQTNGISVSFWMQLPLTDMQSNHRAFGHPAVEATIGTIGYGGLGIHFGNGYHVGWDRNIGYKAFDGQWHHVTATADFTNTRDNVALYLDGREVARVDGVSNNSFNSTKPKDYFYVGARRNGGHDFSGRLDDVALFSYTLSPEQVQAIYHGPVYAGAPIDVYLPDTTTLNGIAPDDARLVWSVHSGPGEVRFADAWKPDTAVKFDTPGSYELTLQVEGYDAKQTLQVTVHPPSPPTARADDPVQLGSTAEHANLQAQVTVPGHATGDLNGVTINWQKNSGPGEVQFGTPHSTTTTARFSEAGLYHLQLSATRNGLTDTATQSVFVGQDNAPHYSLLLNPLYALPLNTPANRQLTGIDEIAGNTVAGLVDPDGILPQMLQGARPFSGLAWDFSDNDAKIKVHNRFNIARLGNIDLTTGLSLSFWMKADAYSNELGRIGGWAGVSINPHKYSQGVAVTIDGTTVATSEKAPELANHLYTGEWHHILATADFTQATDNVRLYIDGQLIDQTSRQFDQNFASDRTDKTHHWGCRENGGGYEFDGQLDDIAVFDRPLSEDEVAYLYNGPSAEQQAQLQAPQPVVDAGADQVHTLPTQKIRLHAQAHTGTDLSYEWTLLSGSSAATFTHPNSKTTDVIFAEPDAELHNKNYRNYIFRMTARNTDGTLARAGTDQVSVVLYDNETPKTRTLSKVPKPGVHPRVLFSPEDLPAMRKRFAADPYAQKAATVMQADYDSKLFNPQTVIGLVYQQLKEGMPNVDVKFVVGENDTRAYWQGNTWLYGSLAGSAAIALMEENDALLEELATVLSNAAHEHLKYYQPNYPNKLVHDASGGLALAYDFLAANMDEAQRQPVRQLLSKMSKWRQTLGSSTQEPRQNSTNWLTHHDQIVLAALAIEGEEGYDADLTEQATQKLRIFLSQHGLFNSGYAHEGYGYFFMGMESGSLSALALSRRGENLYETTNIYNCALMLFRSMPPGSAFASNHGDTGPQIAGHAAPLNWIMRYLWPNDPAVSYLSEKRLQTLLSNDAKDFNLMAILFASEPKQCPSQADSAAELKLALNAFCPDKGHMNARSSWQDDALNLVFRCQQDKYNVGHGHPDINSFELYANGTTWFLDPGKYQNFNDCHQTILIDGRGGNGSSDAMTWPSLPGHFVEFVETDEMVVGVGDAKACYDYSASDSRTKGVTLEKIPAEDADLIWADFVYGKTREALPSMASWRALNVAKLLHTDGQYLYRYNPVQRAFRTAALVKGTPSTTSARSGQAGSGQRHPYALIIDDYQKDDSKHTYQWIGNFEVGTVEVVSQTDHDLILKKIGEDDIGNRLLVRVLQADGLSAAPELVNEVIGAVADTLNTGKTVSQIRITAKGVLAPNFKVLLYPHTVGSPLPHTQLDGNALQVNWDDRQDQFLFKQDDSGRTHIELK